MKYREKLEGEWNAMKEQKNGNMDKEWELFKCCSKMTRKKYVV